MKDGNSGNNYSFTFVATTNGTITAASTSTSVTVTPIAQQYSDPVTFVATITPTGSAPMAVGGTVTFFVGTQQIGTAQPLVAYGLGLRVTLSNAQLLESSLATPWPSAGSNGPLDPDSPTKTVIAVFTGVDTNFSVSNPTTTLTLQKEDVNTGYSGPGLVFTPDVSNPAATIPLSANIQDLPDLYRGDIRNATVTFVDFTNSATGVDIAGCANIPVVTLVLGDSTTGNVTCNWSVNIGNQSSVTYQVGIRVNNYYTKAASAADAMITVSLPLANFVTGGGYLVMQNSAGQYAATAGTRTNFGFDVKYNKSFTNLQGHSNVIFRQVNGGTTKILQIKTNSQTSLGVKPSVGTQPKPGDCATAVYTSQANLNDVTNPLSPVDGREREWRDLAGEHHGLRRTRQLRHDRDHTHGQDGTAAVLQPVERHEDAREAPGRREPVGPLS